MSLPRLTLCLRRIAAPAALAFMLAAAPLAAEQTPLRIASWNLEHLAAPGTGCRPRGKADYAALRRAIATIDADVWRFQEVESKTALRRILPGKSRDWQVLIEDRKPVSDPATCRNDPARFLTMQRTAIAIRRGVNVQRLPDLDLDGRDRLRKAPRLLLLDADGEPLAEVVNVHLKSGCAAGQRAAACATLFKQLQSLVRWNLRRDDPRLPLIVGGDFNRTFRPDDPMSELLARAGFGIVAGDRGSCGSARDSRIDHFALNAPGLGLAVPDQRSEDRTLTAGLSDHCPISLRLIVGAEPGAENRAVQPVPQGN